MFKDSFDRRGIVIAATLVTLGALLFAHLGRYPLWDDETMVGLVAQGVNRTGDTSVLMDHGNIVGYRGGILVRNFRDRWTPPLATYITAASFSLFGVNAWSARWPFALLGLGAYALVLLWARQRPWPELAVLALGLLGNVSLLLYFRQCRYYGPAIFFSVAVAFVYWRWQPRPRELLVMAALSILLFISNCLDYVALYACLSVDYALWHRKQWPLTWRGALLLLAPQVVINGLIACVWNPLRTDERAYQAANTLGDRFILLIRYWRDLNTAEYFAVPLLVLAFVAGVALRRGWLARGCVAVAIFVGVIAACGPQPVRQTTYADIRYAAPIIPLAVALEAGLICALLGRWPWLAMAAAAVVFATNFFNGGLWLYDGLRSTIACYAGELLRPVPEPYTPAADWINAHVPEGASVWVLPDYAAYPLMFRAPRAVYAWQLNWPPRADFAGLPRILFKDQEAPDYLVAFGPFLGQMAVMLEGWNLPDLHYTRVATISVYWHDRYRPELIWHSFKPKTDFDPQREAVYIYQRTSPAPAPR